MKVIAMVYSKTDWLRTNGDFGSENGTSHNSGSNLTDFLKFCRIKGANRYMKILLVVFLEKNSFGAI